MAKDMDKFRAELRAIQDEAHKEMEDARAELGKITADFLGVVRLYQSATEAANNFLVGASEPTKERLKSSQEYCASTLRAIEKLEEEEIKIKKVIKLMKIRVETELKILERIPVRMEKYFG